MWDFIFKIDTITDIRSGSFGTPDSADCILYGDTGGIGKRKSVHDGGCERASEDIACAMIITVYLFFEEIGNRFRFTVISGSAESAFFQRNTA